MEYDVYYPRTFLPKQNKVINALNRHKFILYSGAFGAGKTLLLANVVIMECLKYPRSLWFVGSQTVPQLRDTVLRTFMEEVDLFQDEFRKAGSDLIIGEYKPSVMSYKFFNSSEVLFRSCDDPSKFKSLNLDGFALDEPVDIDEQVFLMLQGRLRARHSPNKVAILVGNPAGKVNWVYQTFFEDKKKGYYTVQTTTYDNTYLPPDYITSCEDSFDPDYANRYLRGEWGSFEGLIYKDFDTEAHVGSFRDKKYEYYIGGYDDGFRNPACLLTLGVDSDMNLHVVNELYEKGRTHDQIVSEIVEINRVYPMRKIYADPSAQHFIETARQHGLRVYDANNDVDNGIARLKMLFKSNKLFVDFGCRNLIKELQSYRYEKDRFSKNPTERPVKKGDHAVDSLRYSVTNFNPFRENIFCGAIKYKG